MIKKKNKYKEIQVQDKTRCSFCTKSYKELPHTCKYCGLDHCSEHILPENHECTGLNKISKWPMANYNSIDNNSIERLLKKSHSIRSPKKRDKLFTFKIPEFSLPKINIGTKMKWFLISISLMFLAYYIDNLYLYLIETVSWIIFAFNFYIGAFNKANEVRLSNDLYFMGMRILSAILFLISGYFFLVIILSSIRVTNSTSILIPIGVMTAGLLLLSMFMIFRTERRHAHVYVNRDY